MIMMICVGYCLGRGPPLSVVQLKHAQSQGVWGEMHPTISQNVYFVLQNALNMGEFVLGGQIHFQGPRTPLKILATGLKLNSDTQLFVRVLGKT